MLVDDGAGGIAASDKVMPRRSLTRRVGHPTLGEMPDPSGTSPGAGPLRRRQLGLLRASRGTTSGLEHRRKQPAAQRMKRIRPCCIGRMSLRSRAAWQAL